MRSSEHVHEFVHGRVLEVDLHGRLTRRDFQEFVPETEKLIARYGKIRLVVMLHNFEGWDLGAMWEEIKWEAKHFNHVERIVILGDERWHQTMATLCRPFTTAAIRYFHLGELEEAYTWVDS
ncbi:MAG TPA: STAS/SEC14 domain-containing protein [Chthoniobacter sp.]|jgi:hypothetical protein